MTDAERWFRGVEDDNSALSNDVERLKQEGTAQVFALRAGFNLLPDRIAEVNDAVKGLSIPVSGTQITYTPDLGSITANTWATVQSFSLSAPVGKTSVKLLAVSTPIIRSTYRLSAIKLFRLIVGGVIQPMSTVGETGMAVGGGTGSGSILVQAQVYLSHPGDITNNTSSGRENSIRTTTVGVWT